MGGVGLVHEVCVGGWVGIMPAPLAYQPVYDSREMIPVPPVAFELNVPPVALLPKVPPKTMTSNMNSDDGEHKIPYLFDDADDTCCYCG